MLHGFRLCFAMGFAVLSLGPALGCLSGEDGPDAGGGDAGVPGACATNAWPVDAGTSCPGSQFLGILPDGVEFGDTPVGCGSVWREVFVCGLPITSDAFVDPPASPFSISAGPAQPLQPDEAHCFTVSYAPTATGRDQGLLLFETNEAGFYTVPVEGTGVASPSCNR